MNRFAAIMIATLMAHPAMAHTGEAAHMHGETLWPMVAAALVAASLAGIAAFKEIRLRQAAAH